MKVFIQSQASECGLACLAMIAWNYGHRSDLAELRQRFSLSLKGATLTRLIAMGSSLGLASRPLRLELDDLKELQVPCILHWDMTHFVVLERATGSSISIVDPAFGRKTMPLAEATTHFTGVAVEFWPDGNFTQKSAPPRVTLGQLTGPLVGVWPAVTRVLLLSSVIQLFLLLVPLYLQWVMDQAVTSADTNLLIVLATAFALLACFLGTASFARGWLVLNLSARIGRQWTTNVFSHVLRLPLDFFEKRHLGDVVSRMGAVQTIQRTLTTSSIEALLDGIMASATILMMIAYSFWLSAVTVCAVLIYLTIRLLMMDRLRQATQEQLEAQAVQHSYLIESFRGIQSLKVAAVEPFRLSGFANMATNSTDKETRVSRQLLTFTASEQLIFGLERVLIIWLGAILVIEQKFSLGMLVAFLAYKELFATRVASLVNKWIEFRMLRLHGERLADVVFVAPEDVGESSTPAMESRSASLEIRDLCFRYADDEQWLIEGCNATIECGQSVAIVGASGCGKSTLIKLLLGLYQPGAGQVLVGGKDIRRLGLAAYRRVVGTVLQDDQLFAGTIADNIALGELAPDPERIREAATLAAVADEIEGMPMGYFSLVGDMGTVLSGGQKQRVLLARALYRSPRILLLDEATSHLDVECETRVNESIRGLNLTRIIVAHKPSTIESADVILRMENGRLHRQEKA